MGDNGGNDKDKCHPLKEDIAKALNDVEELLRSMNSAELQQIKCKLQEAQNIANRSFGKGGDSLPNKPKP